MKTAEKTTYTYFVLDRSNVVLFKSASRTQANLYFAKSSEAISILKREGSF